MFNPHNPLKLALEDGEEYSDEETLLREDLTSSKKLKKSRNRVNLDFASDSDEDNEEWRDLERQREDLMIDEDNGDTVQSVKKQKRVELMDVNNIADSSGESGNEEPADAGDADSLLGDLVNDLDNEEDGEPPAGSQEIAIEKFSLEDNLEEGAFDKDGNFIPREEDPDAHQDQWLDGISAEEISKARIAHEKSSSAVKQDLGSDADHLSAVCSLLDVGETPTENLQKLNTARKLEKPRDVKKGLSQRIVQLTDACEALSRSYGLSVYDKTREELGRIYSKLTGQNIKRQREEEDDEDPDIYYFKWSMEDEECHGPYSHGTIIQWLAEGSISDSAVISHNDEWLQVGEWKRNIEK